jgi:3-hydroxybutyryl-CoA dehydrogenase
MKLENIKTIGIVGAGTMGLGIAQICASVGYKTLLFDINKEAIDKALKIIEKNLSGAVEKGKLTEEGKQNALLNIVAVTDLNQLVADVIIEAAIEKLAIKKELFATLEAVNSPETILASNTSSIPITQIAYGLKNPERVVGMHFFNPAHIMKLVEVILGAATNVEIANTIYDLSIKLGKTPVMAKDSPGFIVNRVARHYYVESLKTLEENVTSFENIDKLLEASGFKMGPFKLMDLIGVDTNYSVTSSMFEQFSFDSKFRPSRIQKQKVDAGHHGKKTGKGFYEYS